MAIALKPSKTYDDIYGNTENNAYGIIDRVSVISGESAIISINIYKNSGAYNSNKSPLSSETHTCNSTNYDTYIAPCLTGSGDNLIAQAEAYLLTILTDWR